MKPAPIILAAIALFFVVDLLVGDETGVLTRLQENSGQAAAAEVQPKPATGPAARTASAAATSSNPWDPAGDNPSVEVDDLVETEVPASGNLPDQTTAARPQAPVQPQAGSPEFPNVPLAKPQLTVAGAQISYPTVVER